MSFRDASVFDVADTRLTGYFEQAVRSSFNFVRRGVLAEAARHLKDRVTVIGSYSLSTVRLFDERIAPEDQPDIDRLFPQVRISKLQGAARGDSRDDALDPARRVVLGRDSSRPDAGRGDGPRFRSGAAGAGPAGGLRQGLRRAVRLPHDRPAAAGGA